LNPVAILPVGVCILDALIVLQDRPAANGAPTARPSATGSAGEWD
jgi:hypothetical protein